MIAIMLNPITAALSFFQNSSLENQQINIVMNTFQTVTIHLPIIQKYYNEANDVGRPMLFGRTKQFHGSYRYIENSFRHSLLKKEEELGISGHVLHDGRHTFSTMAKKYGINEFARKKIMGHAIKDLTDRVYTHMDIEWFRNEIEKIL